MTKKQFYRNCYVAISISIMAGIVSILLLLRAIAYNNIEMQIVFGSLLIFSLILMVLSLIASLGEYKPSKWPPDMPFPIIYSPNKYAISFLDETYWRIDYFETAYDATKTFREYKDKNKLYLKVFTKEYDQQRGCYINKELHWS
jgi:hypothetical protein